jgi:ribonuclease BN (tRNA processing enzyme)
MGMRLTVIGSSPAWPNPGGAHSGYLVEEDGRRLLLDCGPGVLARLRASEMLPLDAIAITHFHLDHWGDLVPWVWMTAHDDMPPTRTGGPVELWIPDGGSAELESFAKQFGTPRMFERTFRVGEYRDEVEFLAAGFQVVPRRVEHFDTNAFAFRVRAPASGAVLAYSGDTAPCPGARATAAGADLFLCEATLSGADGDASPRGHLTAEEALELADGPALLTHRPVELPLLVEAELAADGETIEIRPARA